MTISVQYVPIIIPIRLHYLINRGIGRTIWTISYSWVYMFHQITVEWLLQVLSPSIISIVVPILCRIPFLGSHFHRNFLRLVVHQLQKYRQNPSSPLKSAINIIKIIATVLLGKFHIFYREEWPPYWEPPFCPGWTCEAAGAGAAGAAVPEARLMDDINVNNDHIKINKYQLEICGI